MEFIAARWVRFPSEVQSRWLWMPYRRIRFGPNEIGSKIYCRTWPILSSRYFEVHHRLSKMGNPRKRENFSQSGESAGSSYEIRHTCGRKVTPVERGIFETND
ncbi:uncharacterized protein LOC116849529 isoform X2 [Odontomachus brunneus]|uniref:uncharacterized protein LOC116849529 isoform X2 n=1 Tax=Odontomachus brunneus TaxID=486640 RepID=UPI0013F19357|nr:uncharacterized protein LOC116849529 isoform X2 [Odontomachus brunneus]